MILLKNPEWLIGFLSFVPGIYFMHFWPGRGSRFDFPYSRWSGKRDGKMNRRGYYSFFYILSAVFFWTAAILLVLSLCRPVRIEKQEVFISRGIDILFVLDASPSMGAKDFQPKNRFTAEKQLVKTFISERKNDPVGLVVFGKEASLYSPPTLDYSVLNKRIDTLQLAELGDGTAIGMGLAVACAHLEKSTAPRKVIILITDGEQNAGEIPPLAAAKLASSLGIVVYTLGIGSEGDVPLEYTDPSTGKSFSGTLKSGFDEKLLRSIAGQTGGTYFSAANANVLEQILGIINTIETSDTVSTFRIHEQPAHRILLLFSFSFFLTVFLLKRFVVREVFF